LRYAIISDIHGNIHAFNAVLADAKAQGVDKYLLLGDYTSCFPNANDVASTLRDLVSCVAVCGNGEAHLRNLRGSNAAELTTKQFGLLYWTYKTLTPENYKYLVELPETAILVDGDTTIHLVHSMDLYFRTPKIELFHSGDFQHIMKATPLTHDEYLKQAKTALLTCPDALAEIEAMPKGIYLSGHNHLQFYMEYKGRLFINPGACGEPLDWDTRTAYTILTINGSEWKIDERRVTYDLDAAAEAISTSGFAAYSPGWAEIIELELRTGKNFFAPFLDHLIETGKKMGVTEHPVNNEVWTLAISTWDATSRD